MTAKVPITDNSNYTEDTTPKFDFDATKRGLNARPRADGRDMYGGADIDRGRGRMNRGQTRNLRDRFV
jgi:hypothetical protein